MSEHLHKGQKEYLFLFGPIPLEFEIISFNTNFQWSVRRNLSQEYY